jgi:hypothetical protein
VKRVSFFNCLQNKSRAITRILQFNGRIDHPRKGLLLSIDGCPRFNYQWRFIQCLPTRGRKHNNNLVSRRKANYLVRTSPLVHVLQDRSSSASMMRNRAVAAVINEHRPRRRAIEKRLRTSARNASRRNRPRRIDSRISPTNLQGME